MKKLLQFSLLFVAAFVASCAEDVGTIDRTQPYKIKKSYLEGEWYMRQTVVDVPFNTGFTFIGEQGSTSLIQWDIQENYLIAYRTYEHNPGAEAYLNKGNEPYGTYCVNKDVSTDFKALGFNQDCPEGYKLVSKKAFYGTPLAAYAITSHFDIKRQYNSQTGEQNNVIEENESDRPWYERDYMRVDWSLNLIANFEFGSPDKIPQQGIAYYCPENPDGVDPFCEKWQQKFEDNHFFVVNKILAEPETFEYYGEKYPTCYLYNNWGGDCLGQEISVKLDFLKKGDEAYDYKPVVYNDKKMKKFGYFRTEKYVYDKDRGFLEDSRIYYANVYDFFKRDANGNPIGIKPIVFYTSPGFPAELEAAAQWLANGRYNQKVYDAADGVADGELILTDGAPGYLKGWNYVFEKLAQEVLCNGATSCSLFDPSKTKSFIMCNNPVKETDDILCGERGLSPQIGDLRYNMVYWVANAQASSPLGYGPNAPDPTSGRLISGNAFVYGNALENYTQYALDLIDLFRGNIEVSDFVSGRYINKYLQNPYHTSNDDNVFPSPFVNVEKKRDLTKAIEKLQPKIEAFKEAKRQGKLLTTNFTQTIEKIKGTKYEEMLITKDIKAMFDPSKEAVEMPVSDYQKDMMSPVNWMNPKTLQKQRDLKKMMLKKCIMMGDFIEDSMIGIAMKLAESDMTQKEMFEYIQNEIFYATTIHEIGHVVGLRHNFAASTDTLNYFPEYWNIRLDQLDQDGFAGFGANGLLPRYDEENQAYYSTMIERQSKKGIEEFAYSSIMDYGGRVNTDFKGLGSYDVAAVMFAYGNKLQIFDNDTATEWQYKDGNVAVDVVRHRHYTRTLYDLLTFGSLSRTNYIKNKAKNLEALYSHRKWVDFTEVLDEETLKDKSATDKLVEVPYAFFSDEYESGNYKTYVFDLGADMYEGVKYQISYYKNWYFLNNFKRGRSSFGTNPNAYLGRMFNRLYYIASQYKFMVFEGFMNRDSGDTWYQDKFKGEDLLVAGFDAMNFFAEMLGTVEPGFYKYNATSNYYELSREKDYFNDYDAAPLTGEKEVPLGFGKYLETKYDHSLGYNYYYQPVVLGSWLDKVVAMYLLGDPYSNLMGVDDRIDTASYIISFTSFFSEDIIRLLGGIILDKPEYASAYFLHVGGNANNAELRPAKGVFLWNNEGEEYAANKANTKYIKSSNPFIVKYYAVILGLAYFNALTYLDFAKNIEVGIVGNDDSFIPGVEIDDPAVVKAEDPMTHQVYYAVNHFANSPTAADELPKVSIGYELIQDFAAVVADYNDAKDDYENGSITEDEYMTKLELVKSKKTYIDFVVGMLHFLKHPYEEF